MEGSSIKFLSWSTGVIPDEAFHDRNAGLLWIEPTKKTTFKPECKKASLARRIVHDKTAIQPGDMTRGRESRNSSQGGARRRRERLKTARGRREAPKGGGGSETSELKPLLVASDVTERKCAGISLYNMAVRRDESK
eukprot:764656-Hanusia_phi.AAC.3